jgi:hypothetical protein
MIYVIKMVIKLIDLFGIFLFNLEDNIIKAIIY